MVSNESELKQDVRQLTGYNTGLSLSDDGLDAAYRSAKRHIRVRASLDPTFNWFDQENPAAQEALFWFTCLFTKVQTGELDSQDLQIGAIDQKTLLANDDGSVTIWYRNAESAIDSLDPSAVLKATSPSRSDRSYTAGTFDSQDGTDSTEVDSTDL